ncbi:MAG: 50S ribosomal protein L31 [Bdellovibrionales bacterium]|nr:50S ribosomal protein L31 [Bdellovibrionales bacterium]
MKDEIHPEYADTTVKCGGCGAELLVGSVSKEMGIGVCWNCHPFYTGKARVLDSEGRVDQFERKFGKFLQERKQGKKKAE